MPGSWRTDAWLCATTDTALSSSHCCRALAYSWLRGGSHANSENCLLPLKKQMNSRKNQKNIVWSTCIRYSGVRNKATVMGIISAQRRPTLSDTAPQKLDAT